MNRFILSLAAFALIGCSKKSEPPPSSEPPPTAEASPAAQKARTTFDTLCVTCHGTDGKGDGPGAAKLDPKPRNYTDKTWQASVTDSQIRNIIVGGGASVGKSPAMPASPQFKDDPQALNELVKIVRSFGQ